LDVTHREFFEGLTQNNSIEKVNLLGGNEVIGTEVFHEILKSYQSNSNNLVDLFIRNTRLLQYGGNHVLALTLKSCSNLTFISLKENDIGDEQLLALIDALRGNQSLESLDLEGNRIGDAGCETISTLLLTSPHSNLKVLGLKNNYIGNDGATSIANSLANNYRLRRIYVRHNPMNINVVEDAYSTLLCNTSSINQTYSSNHTLERLVGLSPSNNLDNHLHYLLEMNRDTNKSYVAIRKILKYHPKIDMEPFFGWDAEGEWTLKGLPYVLAWFEKAREADQGYDDDTDSEDREVPHSNVEKRKLLAIYEFAKAMPLQFVASFSIKAGDKKRKRDR